MWSVSFLGSTARAQSMVIKPHIRYILHLHLFGSLRFMWLADSHYSLVSIIRIKMYENQLLKNSTQTICHLCLVNDATSDNISELICGHSYHQKCIISWLRHNDKCIRCRGAGSIVIKDSKLILPHLFWKPDKSLISLF